MTQTERCKQALAKTILKFRRQCNVKRQYLAEALGISAAAIDKMEQGISNPKFYQVLMLARAMNISPEEFFIVFEREYEKLTPLPENMVGR